MGNPNRIGAATDQQWDRCWRKVELNGQGVSIRGTFFHRLAIKADWLARGLQGLLWQERTLEIPNEAGMRGFYKS